MVAREDLRPTRPDDSLKRFINGIKNGKTVPVGLKVAQPNEGYIFYDSTETAHPWNGDTIQVVNDRLAEAQQIMAETRANLEQTRLDLDAAKDRIQASTGDLSVYDARIQAAEAQVASTAAELDTVQDTLNTTSTDLAGLESRAGSIESALAQVQQDTMAAQQAASDATSDANDALAYAQQVKATADNAQATATNAESAARTANDAATAASNKALEAAGLASAAGRVIYGASAPTATADKQPQNLWINTSTNAPNRWDGVKWVVVTDKVATDAAAVAASAQTSAQAAQAAADSAKANAATAQATADKAVKDAAAAASTAQAAQVAAGNAQKTADGKTVVQYGTVTPPPNPGATKGDIYYYTGTDNRIIEQWQYSGTTWVKRALESAQLANFDAGYITSGYLDVAKRIQAGSIFADKLMVGIGDNIFVDPLFTSWAPEVSTARRGVGQGIAGGNAIVIESGTTQRGVYWGGIDKGYQSQAVGNLYRVSAQVHSDTDMTGSANATIYVRFYNSMTGSWKFGTPSMFSIQATTSWQTLAGNFTPPADGFYDRICVGFHVNGSHSSPTYFANPAVREMKDGSLIVNGSITGDKVNAQSVAASVGQFVKVQATNVEVTGELASRVAQFMDASAKKLVVSEEAILQHTTLLGTTVADQLNVRGLLRGRDAILTGTVDIAQLNVTETMAAEIARFMSVETKRAVVSEDAILQRATVIENIVTPELVADRINVKSLGAELLTAGALQTSTAPNAGVKITSSGYKAYDAAGNITVDLNGRANKIVGQLSTSADGGAGVNLVQSDLVSGIELYPAQKNSLTPDNHGSIWYDAASRGSEQGLVLSATRNAAVANTDPAILLRPGTSGIDFQGRFSGQGTAMKTGMQTGTSVPGKGWWTIKVTFPSLMHGDPAVFISPVTENNVECSVGIKNATRFGFEAVVVNQSSRDSGNAWIKWIALAI